MFGKLNKSITLEATIAIPPQQRRGTNVKTPYKYSLRIFLPSSIVRCTCVHRTPYDRTPFDVQSSTERCTSQERHFHLAKTVFSHHQNILLLRITYDIAVIATNKRHTQKTALQHVTYKIFLASIAIIASFENTYLLLRSYLCTKKSSEDDSYNKKNTILKMNSNNYYTNNLLLEHNCYKKATKTFAVRM